jgi:hypothetical protein
LFCSYVFSCLCVFCISGKRSKRSNPWDASSSSNKQRKVSEETLKPLKGAYFAMPNGKLPLLSQAVHMVLGEEFIFDKKSVQTRVVNVSSLSNPNTAIIGSSAGHTTTSSSSNANKDNTNININNTSSNASLKFEAPDGGALAGGGGGGSRSTGMQMLHSPNAAVHRRQKIKRKRFRLVFWVKRILFFCFKMNSSLMIFFYCYCIIG